MCVRIVEDGSSSPAVLLMNYDSPDYVIPADGCGNLPDEVTKAYQAGAQKVIVFIDVLPDNRHTIKEYNRLRKIRRRKYPTLQICPIISTEQRIFSMLVALGVVDGAKFPQGFKNIEEMFKLLLNSGVKDCLQIGHKRQYTGKFYTQDCCMACASYTLSYKATYLREHFPLFELNSSYIQKYNNLLGLDLSE